MLTANMLNGRSIRFSLPGERGALIDRVDLDWAETPVTAQPSHRGERSPAATCQSLGAGLHGIRSCL